MPEWGPFGLDGRAAVVTGANRGIGRSIAVGLAAAGADVVLVVREQRSAEAVVREIEAIGSRTCVVKADVTDPTSGQLIVDRCVEAFDRLDILVNNAGIFPFAPVGQIASDQFRSVLDVNLEAPLRLSQEVAGRMKTQPGGGVIINIASTDSVRPSLPGFATYGASKAALRQITKAMALELGPDNIRVVSVSPGVILDEEDELDGEMLKEFTAKVPLGRMGQPDDVSAVVVFLASDAAKYVTGEDVLVEGGRLLT